MEEHKTYTLLNPNGSHTKCFKLDNKTWHKIEYCLSHSSTHHKIPPTHTPKKKTKQNKDLQIIDTNRTDNISVNSSIIPKVTSCMEHLKFFLTWKAMEKRKLTNYRNRIHAKIIKNDKKEKRKQRIIPHREHNIW